jgi:hypothetical protein
MLPQFKNKPHRFGIAGLAAATCAIVLSGCGGGGSSAGSAPVATLHIAVQPQAAAVARGGAATFSVSATGSGAVSYQWTRNGVSIPGATEATYVRANVQEVDSASVIRVEVKDSNGSVTSAPVTLSISSRGIHQFAGIIDVIGMIPTPDPSHGSANGLGQEARFAVMGDIAMDAAENIYVADYSGATVRKMSPAGLTSTIAGMWREQGTVDGRGADARFMSPFHIATTRNGTVFIQDGYPLLHFPIRKITPDGTVTTLAEPRDPLDTNADGSPSVVTVAQFSVDAADNLYVLTDAAILGKCAPWVLSVSCTSGYTRHTLHKITPAGARSTLLSTDNLYASLGSVFGAAAVTADAAGNVFVGNTSEILRITPAGEISRFAGHLGMSGTVDGPGTQARFKWVENLVCDTQGNLFALDGNAGSGQAIRKITSTGVVTTIAGGPSTAATTLGDLPGSLKDVSGLAVDKNGNIYIGALHGVLKIVP